MKALEELVKCKNPECDIMIPTYSTWRSTNCMFKCYKDYGELAKV